MIIDGFLVDGVLLADSLIFSKLFSWMVLEVLSFVCTLTLRSVHFVRSIGENFANYSLIFPIHRCLAVVVFSQYPLFAIVVCP